MHPGLEGCEELAIVVGGLVPPAGGAAEGGQAAEGGDGLEALQRFDEVLADVDRLLEILRAAEDLVDAHQGQGAVGVAGEAALVAQLLQHLRRPLGVAGKLGDPGLGEDRELVDVAVLLVALGGQAGAGGAGVVRPQGHEEAEGALQLEQRRRLAPELVLPQGEELAGAALGVLGELQHAGEAHPRPLAFEGQGADLRPAGDGGRELAADVLDLGQQAQAVAVLRLVGQAPHDLRLGGADLADLDQDGGEQQALVQAGGRLFLARDVHGGPTPFSGGILGANRARQGRLRRRRRVYSSGEQIVA